MKNCEKYYKVKHFGRPPKICDRQIRLIKRLTVNKPIISSQILHQLELPVNKHRVQEIFIGYKYRKYQKILPIPRLLSPDKSLRLSFAEN